MARKSAESQVAESTEQAESTESGSAWPLPDDHYFYLPVTSARGHDGGKPADREAIREIQLAVGVDVTGVYDEATAEAVEAISGSKAVTKTVWESLIQ